MFDFFSNAFFDFLSMFDTEQAWEAGFDTGYEYACDEMDDIDAQNS